MPPRLPVPSAFRASAPSLHLLRPFSSTPSISAPPRDFTHPLRPAGNKQPPTSSTSSLLSINNPDRKHRPSGGYNSNNSNNSSGSNNNTAGGQAANRMLNRYKDRAEIAARGKQAQIDFLRNRKVSTEYLKQMPRRWAPGDVYSPHDLSSVEMKKWRQRSPRNTDVIDALGIRPLDMYKNFSLIREFTTSSGQILHPTATGLRPVNHRKIAKMIRRIQGMGLYPTIHDHPEMIRDDFFPERR